MIFEIIGEESCSCFIGNKGSCIGSIEYDDASSKGFITEGVGRCSEVLLGISLHVEGFGIDQIGRGR